MHRVSIAIALVITCMMAVSARSVDNPPWWKSVEAFDRSLKDDPALLSRHFEYGVTVLHVAAERGDVDVVRAMLDHGADPNRRADDDSTPLLYALRGAQQIAVAMRYRDKPHLANMSAEPSRYLETVKLLLARHADVNAADRSGDTALHAAARIPSPFLASRLLEAGARANATARYGNDDETVLETAVQSHSREVVRMLLAHGASVHFADERRRILLAQSAAGDPGVLRQLIAAGADFSHRADGSGPGDCAMAVTALGTQLESIKILAQHDAGTPKLLERAFLASLSSGPDRNPLVRFRRLRTVEWLIQHGVSPSAPDNSGLALLSAASQGHVEIVLLLKAYGVKLDVSKFPGNPQRADLDRSDFDAAIVDAPWRAFLSRAVGYPLGLNASAAYGFVDDVRENLRKHPEAINGIPSASPLMFAARGGHLEIVKLLLDQGADVNPQVERGGWFGATPLEAAAALGHVEVMRLLIERGADVNVKDEHGETLLDRLKRTRGAKREAIDLLTSHGAVQQ
jgi:ankyrin repeat protein